MGNTQTVPEIFTNETEEVTRYTVNAEKRYGGSTKLYVYESKHYDITITPYNKTNPIQRYNESDFKGMSNEKTTLKVKKSFLIQCVEYLKAKETVENLVQIHLAVN